MTYGAFLIGHPLFWAAMTGTALGAALATATRDARRDRRPARARSRKWTGAALWATAGVLAATGGILLPDGFGFFGLPSLSVGAGVLVFVGLALRFPRSAGLPAFLILAATTAIAPLVMRPFVPVRDTGVAATVRLLAVDQSDSYLEINDRTPNAIALPQVVTTPDPTVVARVHFLQVSDYLFFLGGRGGIALDTVRSAGAEPITSPESDVMTLYAGTRFIERAIDLLPLLTLTPLDSEPVQLNLLQEYEIVGFPEAEVRIQAVPSAVLGTE